MGRIKSGCATIYRRDCERLALVKDHTFALVRRGVGNLRHTHPRSVFA